VKFSRKHIFSRVFKIPEIKFEDQRLTSFAGIVLYQPVLQQLQIKERLKKCFTHLKVSEIFGHPVIMLLLVLHLVMGYRKLRDLDYYQDDPLVKRLLGLQRLPNVATVSRALRAVDQGAIEKVRGLVRDLVIQRLQQWSPARLTLDFDGSVISTTQRRAEGTAVGFNKQRKGARSYYPLFCTIAQTGQVLDVLFRPGNVHDSNGAKAFIQDCLQILREALPGVTLEARLDSAFFSDDIVTLLETQRVEFSLSVPFERFAELKHLIQERKRWKRMDGRWAWFETFWKPKKWDTRFRFLLIRQRVPLVFRGPIQLDLFVPHEEGYAFKVIVTNKQIKAKKVLMFHNGRADQEGLFGELKSQAQMDYIPVRRQGGNQFYNLAAILAHNLTREIQMMARPRDRGTTEKRSALWSFVELKTLRHLIIQRAGRLTAPKGKLTLTMSANEAVQKDLLGFLEAFKEAA
jgi:Transposase DDE domain group 1